MKHLKVSYFIDKSYKTYLIENKKPSSHLTFWEAQGRFKTFTDFPVPTPLLHGSTYSTQSCLFLIKNLASTVQKIGRKMSILLNCL